MTMAGRRLSPFAMGASDNILTRSEFIAKQLEFRNAEVMLVQQASLPRSEIPVSHILWVDSWAYPNFTSVETHDLSLLPSRASLNALATPPYRSTRGRDSEWGVGATTDRTDP